ncbi:MFS transporter [Paraburkholderia sp. EB58]|uniref:MFS transporter n=1 Tax=Paraburkholderia sp. EB58 TaxID=3035125 RepID=UPI003D24EF40
MSRKLMLLLCVSVPSFMINLDANIVAVSLSSIAKSLHADFAAIEWVISAYTLAFATLVMPAGALADRFGRKRVLIIGLLVFTIASFFCGAASSSAVLNVARAVQGVGAALQLSAALAVLSHGFQGRERAKAFAFWGSVIGVAIMLGPIAGGLITQVLGWQWAFYVNLPIGLVMIGITMTTVEESNDPYANRVDVAGVLTFSGFLGLLTWALILGNRIGWSSAEIRIQLSGSAAFLIAFLVVEARQSRPMVDLGMFFKRTYLGANTAAVSFAVTFLTMLTYLPFFFQSALGYSPFHAGILMLPLVVPLFVVPRIISSHLEHRLSGRGMLVLGLLLVAVGLLFTAMCIPRFSYLAIATPMFVASIGAGILNGQVVKVGMTVIPVERAGMASGISGAMRFSGVVVGFAALGAILFQRIASSLNQVLPGVDESARVEITRLIANGNVDSAGVALTSHGATVQLALQTLAHGYVSLMLAASAVGFIAAAIAWLLIDPAETPAHSKATVPVVTGVSID